MSRPLTHTIILLAILLACFIHLIMDLFFDRKLTSQNTHISEHLSQQEIFNKQEALEIKAEIALLKKQLSTIDQSLEDGETRLRSLEISIRQTLMQNTVESGPANRTPSERKNHNRLNHNNDEPVYD